MLGHRLDWIISKVLLILWFCRNDNKEKIFLEAFRSEEGDGVLEKNDDQKMRGDFKKDRKRNSERRHNLIRVYEEILMYIISSEILTRQVESPFIRNKQVRWPLCISASLFLWSGTGTKICSYMWPMSSIKMAELYNASTLLFLIGNSYLRKIVITTFLHLVCFWLKLSTKLLWLDHS